MIRMFLRGSFRYDYGHNSSPFITGCDPKIAITHQLKPFFYVLDEDFGRVTVSNGSIETNDIGVIYYEFKPYDLRREYQKRYGNAYEAGSPDNDRLMKLFHSACEKYGIIHTPDECFRYISEMPEAYSQLSLFDMLD